MKTFRKVLTGVILLTASTAARAQVASLVQDLHPGSDSGFAANPVQLAVLGDRLIFSATEGESGGELWVSDGTAGGTESLAELCTGDCGSAVLVASTRELTYWTVFDSQLWRSDGTRAGTFPLAANVSTRAGINPPSSLLATRGDVLFFAACEDDPYRCTVWRTDGTHAGTREVLDRAPRALTTAANRVFVATDEELWRLDPGSETPVLVTRFERIELTFSIGNRLLLQAADAEGNEELWSSDGTAAGTRPLTRFAASDPFGFEPSFVSTGRRLYFVADDIEHGNELWVSDGTPGGTRRITDFAYKFPFRPHSLGRTLQEVGNRVIFEANEQSGGAQVLWSTDGRPESTVRLSTLCPADCYTEEPLQTARAGNLAVFPVRDARHAVELWVTDGTPAGTRLLQDFCPDFCLSGDSGFSFMTPAPASGQAYFSTYTHLWRSDGTAAGTRRLNRRPLQPGDSIGPLIAFAGGETFVKLGGFEDGSLRLLKDGELEPLTFGPGRSAGSDPRYLFAHGGSLWFRAEDESGSGLWRTGGSAATTHLLTRNEDLASLEQLVQAGGVVYFFDPSQFLWRFTDEGTEMVADLRGDESGPYYASATGGALGSHLYFDVRRDGTAEIWRTDGTPAGTGRFMTLPLQLNVTFITASGGRLYFGTYDTEAQTNALWTSDGTAAGTRQVFTFDTYEGALPRFIRVGEIDYFLTYHRGDLNQNRLWRTDGMPGGTALVPLSGQAVRVADGMAERQGSLYVLGEDYGYPFGTSVLWKVDGGSAVRLRTFGEHREELEIVTVGSLVVFSVDDGEHGIELWSTDGTVHGTRLVRDLVPGRFSSGISGLTAVGGRAFFSARDDDHGMELWETVGTAAGTRLVHDVAPGPASSFPRWLTAAGDRLYFAADDGLAGRELWVLPLASASDCQPSSRVLCLQNRRFRVEATWRAQGSSGAATAVPLTTDTGYFWFFDAANAEVMLKVLDGHGLNGHFWVFYGALSDVEYSLTVTDTGTGLTQRYFNPSGRLASVGDTTAFGPEGAFVPRREPLVAPPSPAALVSARTEPVAATGSCQPGPLLLCLNGGRFAVEASWKDFQGNTGRGTAVPLTADTGHFWFFDAANVEVMLKVLDGTPLNGRFWVFYGALSNVEYDLTVTDTHTGAVKVYSNPSGRFASVADTGAF